MFQTTNQLVNISISSLVIISPFLDSVMLTPNDSDDCWLHPRNWNSHGAQKSHLGHISRNINLDHRYYLMNRPGELKPPISWIYTMVVDWSSTIGHHFFWILRSFSTTIVLKLLRFCLFVAHPQIHHFTGNQRWKISSSMNFPFQWPGTMAQAGIPASQSRNKRWWSGSWITWHQWWWNAMIPKKLYDDWGRSNSSIDLSHELSNKNK